MWTNSCFYFSLVVFVCSCFAAVTLLKLPYQRGRFLSPSKCVLAGVFLASVLLFLPIHLQKFPHNPIGHMQTFLLSVLNTMKLFVLDGEFDMVLTFSAGISNSLVRVGYPLLASSLYILAPALSFGFVLSFFKNISAHRDFLLHFTSNIYVFSELNERALFLAESIKKKDDRSFIVFTDVFENNVESVFELCERARALNAACFKASIIDINWNIHSKRASISLFTIGEDESENIEHSIHLVGRYRSEKNFRLYVFCSNLESEILFNTSLEGGMRIRRINACRSLINQTLYHKGIALFENALEQPEKKLISILLLGLGQYGAEMLKALSWFCQMDGYQVQIHVIDKDPNAVDRFSMLCPELMSSERNGTNTPTEAEYKIVIHSGIDVETIQFADILHEVGPISHVYVALGNDSLNIKTAVNTRILCERNHIHPLIQAIVYNPLKTNALKDITDYRGHSYEIEFFGDLRSSFSENVIIDSELEELALKRHLKWGKENDFWANEFNYRSSVAAAIHLKIRQLCGIPGAELQESELTDDERRTIEILEHKRWNAYMRSEGYVYSGSTAAESRNDLAKTHNNLVPFNLLNEEDQHKDSRIGTE